jgi:ornithine--oxo-acid transaminase
LLILAKGLSGGTYPVSAVLGSNEIMLGIKPGQHGSTFGGNPLACRMAITALEVLRDEDLAENARHMGERLRKGLRSIPSDKIMSVRGRGLLNAVIIDTTGQEKEDGGDRTWNMCIKLRDAGLLTRPTQGNIIRLQPPLCITAEQIDHSLEILSEVLSKS